ncbi:hypothetical protein D3C81_1943970 [compost metagenome]
MSRPEALWRCTAHQAVKSGFNGVIGASEWIANGMPRRRAVPAGFMRAARAGPTVCVAWASPQ